MVDAGAQYNASRRIVRTARLVATEEPMMKGLLWVGTWPNRWETRSIANEAEGTEILSNFVEAEDSISPRTSRDKKRGG